MKKVFMPLMAIVLLISFAVAEGTVSSTEVFEVSGRVLTVRLPEGEQPCFAFYSGDYNMEPLAEGETVNGITTVSYMLPENALGESQLFAVTADWSVGEQTDVRTALFESQRTGELFQLGISQSTPDYFTDCSEGYEYSEGKTLQITLPGSSATGYEWSLIPDNSGILQLVDSYEIDTRDNEEDPLTTAMGFFFIPVENPAGTESNLIFTLNKSPAGEKTGKTLEFRIVLDEDGQIAEVIRKR